MKTYPIHAGELEEVSVNIGLYSVRDFMGQELPGLALLLIDARFMEQNADPEDINYDEVLSVSFGEFISIRNSFYVDTNNCPYAEEFLTKNNIAVNTGLSRSSGFCRYPLYVLTPEFIEELKTDTGAAGKNYKTYLDAVENYDPFRVPNDET